MSTKSNKLRSILNCIINSLPIDWRILFAASKKAHQTKPFFSPIVGLINGLLFDLIAVYS